MKFFVTHTGRQVCVLPLIYGISTMYACVGINKALGLFFVFYNPLLVTSNLQQCGVEAMFTRRLFASYEK
jgi:hypothetical protein